MSEAFNSGIISVSIPGLNLRLSSIPLPYGYNAGLKPNAMEANTPQATDALSKIFVNVDYMRFRTQFLVPKIILRHVLTNLPNSIPIKVMST